MNICKSADCTGCFACLNICKHGAITIAEDENGQTIPKINSIKCVSCGLCERVCPANYPMEFIRASKAYAVWSKNEEDRVNSSSGGAAAIFSRTVLRNGGIVYGAYSGERKVKHICVSNEEQLWKLCGSKYVQSDIGIIYADIKQQLHSGRTAIFIGTPCQVAGLKSYLKKEYENLMTVDLICHGVVPWKYLKEHIDNKCKNKKWDAVSFRGKSDYCLTVYDNDIVCYQCDCFKDEYFCAFLEGLTFRDSCYQCKYARPERIADITIGDFWGLDRKKMCKKYEGRISLVLPNTKKGIDFFEQTKEQFDWEERSIAEAMNEAQGNLLHPTVMPEDREQFLIDYKKYGFEKAVKKSLTWKRKQRELRKKNFRVSISHLLRKLKHTVRRKR